MLTRSVFVALFLVALVIPAAADATDAGKAVSEAFQKSCSAGDIAGVMKLYEEDATVIWPGQGEFAKGKPAIEKLATGLCKSSSGKLKLISQESKQLGKGYIVNVGRWETTTPGRDGKATTTEIRTTEVLHQSGGKWRYVVDHASIGLPSTPESH